MFPFAFTSYENIAFVNMYKLSRNHLYYNWYMNMFQLFYSILPIVERHFVNIIL
jgi:hypothetical protein